MLLGRILRDVVIMMVQMCLVIVLVLPFGLRVDVLGAIVGMLLLAVLGVGLATLSCLVALVTKQTHVLAVGARMLRRS